uniref:Uncharacterized protein n=1 Tax=Desulfobacca acetoxidans TaxID=60893 RepID=A0A7V4G997_9BACT
MAREDHTAGGPGPDPGPRGRLSGGGPPGGHSLGLRPHRPVPGPGGGPHPLGGRGGLLPGLPHRGHGL